MSVHTKVLTEGSVSTTATTVYTCPTGKTAIVKTLAIGKSAAPADTMTVTLTRAGNVRTALVAPLGVGAGATTPAPYWVLAPGDGLRLQTATGAMTYWVSGVELIGVA